MKLYDKYADSLRVRIFGSRAEMGAQAAYDCAARIKKLLAVKNEINVVFAAAPSQNEFLASLLEQDIDFTRINAFHMDEYIGLPADAPQGFGNFLKEHIFSRAQFKSVNYIDSTASDPESECKRYAELLERFPIDIVCMGIGENGHIAFNDPGTGMANFSDPLAVKPVTLDEICRRQQVNDGCFEKLGDVPLYAITLTVPTLVSASHIFCVVPAATKAQAVYNTVNGTISAECPASVLRLHRDAALYCDAESGAGLLKEQTDDKPLA